MNGRPLPRRPRPFRTKYRDFVIADSSSQSETTSGRAILREGETCWRLAATDRLAFLVDGKSYYDALVGAMRRARHSILIVGWDIDSRTVLQPDGEDPDSTRLGVFLESLARNQPDLHIRVLVWDFSMIYALEREPLPVFQLGWKTHPRVEIQSDGEHPFGGSQHQKLVVIDDRVAFAGGLDLTKARWDTSEHAPGNPQRRLPAGGSYGPFHDLQALVDGDAAEALGALARERWEGATGCAIEPPAAGNEDPWPEGVEPDVRDTTIGIARTLPAYKTREQVEEVKRLYLESIAASERYIYVENQYFTSVAVRKALATRLEEEDGPEVVLVLPRRSSGWMEESTMDTLRALQLNSLQRSDRHGRLRLYYPAATSDAATIMVHAKLMVVDGRLARVGSANLSNRSMGLDSECDLALEAGFDDEETRSAVGALLHRLLAEHLNTDPDTVARILGESGSLIRTIEQVQGEGRTLRTLEPGTPPKLPVGVDEDSLIDPEKPVELDAMMDALLRDGQDDSGMNPYRIAAWVGVLVLAAMGAGYWVWAPDRLQPDFEALLGWGTSLAATPLAWLWVLLVYLAGAMVMFPITVLILATASVFDPLPALAYALLGSLTAAVSTYCLGALLGRKLVRRMAGGTLNRVSRRLAERGIIAVAVTRLLPIAPFSLLNLVAGASHIRLRDFVAGTVLGMLPGIVLVTLVVDSVRSTLLSPTLVNIVTAGALGLVVLLGGWWLRRRTRRRRAGD